jgi:hypothetical protein
MPCKIVLGCRVGRPVGGENTLCKGSVSPTNVTKTKETYRSSGTLVETSLDHSLNHILHDLLIGLLLGSLENGRALLRRELVELLIHDGG